MVENFQLALDWLAFVLLSHHMPPRSCVTHPSLAKYRLGEAGNLPAEGFLTATQLSLSTVSNTYQYSDVFCLELGLPSGPLPKFRFTEASPGL